MRESAVVNSKIIRHSEKLLAQLTAALVAIEKQGLDRVQECEQKIQAILPVIQELKQHTTGYSFSERTEEIYFFKRMKPEFTSLFICNLAIFNIESERPVGPAKSGKEYYEQEQDRIQQYFDANAEFHKYYRSGATHLDEQYFTRGNLDIHMPIGTFMLDLDGNFSTMCDYKIARILANEKISEYLQSAISALELQQQAPTSKGSIPALSWTASKTDLIELLYGFYCFGAINNGNVELSKIVSLFESLFNTSLGNYCRVFQQIRIRKNNRTSFIDSVREKLIGYMDELDLQ